MALYLCVTTAFADFNKGDQITDPAQVAEYAESHAAHVVKVMGEDPPAAKPAKASASAADPA